MSTVVKKSFVINNDMVAQTSSHIINLFKPPYNPFMDRTIANGGTNQNYFPLQEYPQDFGAGAKNPVKTIYNDKNIITNLFLCTENFLNFIGKINTAWFTDTKPRTLTKLGYKVDPVTGVVTVDPALTDTTPQTILYPLIQGPTANYASNYGINQYESAMAEKGLWQTGSTSYDGAGSTSIQELFLRYLYSLDQKKRDIAFQIAELYYGLSNTECIQANKEFIPAEDFNSDKFNISIANDEITLEYTDPIKMMINYDETIHNATNKKLYLYFPYVTSNAMRALAVANQNISSNSNQEDTLISLFTGVVSPTNTANDRYQEFKNAGSSFTYRMGANPPSYGTLVVNNDMPTLTNHIWSRTKNKFVNQAGYTALNITETGGGGDITFDHIDKIDYIDSLKFVIKAPTVFS